MPGEKVILAIVLTFTFFTLLIILGMPEMYQLISGFEFLWFGGGIVTIASACVVITGVPCAAASAVFGALTIAQYMGLGAFLSTGTVGTVEIIKAVVLTPLSILIIYVFAKLARGGG